MKAKFTVCPVIMYNYKYYGFYVSSKQYMCIIYEKYGQKVNIFGAMNDMIISYVDIKPYFQKFRYWAYKCKNSKFGSENLSIISRDNGKIILNYLTKFEFELTISDANLSKLLNNIYK